MSAVLTSRRKSSVSRETVEVIRCGAGEDIYCLEMSAVAGVYPARDLQSPQQSDAPGVIGTMKERGRDVPVFDLSDLLDLPQETTQAGNYVVLIDHPDDRYGIRVESVSRVIQLVEDKVMPLPKPLENTGRMFRGIVDFTRERIAAPVPESSRHLPGISEPKKTPSNRRRSQHQMQLLLNSKNLRPDDQTSPAPSIPFEFLQKRYASVSSLGRLGNGRQMVVFPLGVMSERQLLIGLTISQVVEITEPLTLITIPGSHPTIWGFVHWRNCPVPVLDLESTLKFQTDNAPLTHLLIVRDHQSGGLVALPVTGRVQSLRLPVDHRPCSLSLANLKPYSLGTFEMEERLLFLPRISALSGLTDTPASN